MASPHSKPWLFVMDEGIVESIINSVVEVTAE